MITDWHSGTPSIGEWNGAWRAIDTEGEVTQEEWQPAWESLDRFLSNIGKNGFDGNCDFLSARVGSMINAHWRWSW